MEEVLKARIFTRGNEIILDSPDSELQSVFSEIIKQIKEHQKIGNTPDPELVKTIHSTVMHDSGGGGIDLLKQLHITIPSSPKVFPRNVHQAEFIEGMSSHDICFAIGPAGTGKTYLAVAYALKEILERKKKRLILTRPVVEAGESLGYLPGDLTQKISPYLRPLYDAMDDLLPLQIVNKLEEGRIIEIAPLAYMRGRSLKESYIVLDEAQNTTKEQMKMFLTRIGEGSKAIITGDLTQIDLPRPKNSGLLHASTILRPLEEIFFTYFTAQDVVRNPLVRKIVNAYENEDQS
ncbi:MAG TPA: PhoH family protein [Sediminispirochaeta sp.]|nr:PhoH family protein [Sediminispirochaeta sp.]